MTLAVVHSLGGARHLRSPQELEDFEQQLVDQYALAVAGAGATDRYCCPPSGCPAATCSNSSPSTTWPTTTAPPAIQTWFITRVQDLPEPMRGEVRTWFGVMLHGSTVPPRSKLRSPVTVRIKVRSALPMLRGWAAGGVMSLHEISRDDVLAALPPPATRGPPSAQPCGRCSARSRAAAWSSPTRPRASRPARPNGASQCPPTWPQSGQRWTPTIPPPQPSRRCSLSAG